MEIKRKTMIRFTCLHDVWLLREVLAINPFNMQIPKVGWDKIAENLKPLISKEICARRCRERTNLLLDYYRKCAKANVRQPGSEELYQEKDQLLHDIIQMQDEANEEKTNHIEIKDKMQLEEEEDVVKHLLIEMECQAEDDEKSNSECSSSAYRSCQSGERALLEYLQQKEANRSKLQEVDQKLKQRQLELEERKLQLEEMKWNFEKSERLADRKVMMNMMSVIMQNCLQKTS